MPSCHDRTAQRHVPGTCRPVRHHCWQRRIRLLSRLNLLGVTQSVFFMVPEQTQTSTSSTAAAGITSGTECAGGDGPSSAVLGSAGQVSTDSNTVSVVSTAAGTHVVHGCNTVTAERQNVKQSKKKTQQTELIKRQISEWGLKKPSSARNKVWDQAFLDTMSTEGDVELVGD